jgi:pyruvate dehydrogenase kinase 2/3/4
MKSILEYSKKATKPVSLQELFRTTKSREPAQRLRNAQYLHEELPVRLAQRIEELKTLPFGLDKRSTIVETRLLYEDSFNKILESPMPTTMPLDDQFTAILLASYRNHNTVIQNMAIGVLEMKADTKYGTTPEQVGISYHALFELHLTTV